MAKRLAFADASGAWVYWNGEPRPLQGQVGLFQIPISAALDYSWQKLRTFGLYAFDEATVPDGKIVVSRSLVDDAGKPKEVLQLADPSMDTLWAELRAERDRRLAQCDWTQLSDTPIDQPAWAAYRQALRDLPANTADPANPVWPSPPTDAGVVA